MNWPAVGLDPKIYFRDVLFRIGHETDIAILTPHGVESMSPRGGTKALRGATTVKVTVSGNPSTA